jgi:hypothetical protein
MADYSYHQLKHTKVAELRDIASKLSPPVEGYSQLNKEQLVERICRQLHVDMHARHEVKGLDKTPIKQQLRELRKSREAALAAHDHKALKDLRRQVHALKRTIRKARV